MPPTESWPRTPWPRSSPVTFYGGFQHITYMNPSIDLAPGFDDIGGYVLGAVNNTAYAKGDKS
jgi:hypothetical protein